MLSSGAQLWMAWMRRGVDAPAHEDLGEVFADDDDRVAVAEGPLVEGDEIFADELADHRELVAEHAVGGEAVDVLHPGDEPHAVAAAPAGEPLLRDRGRVAGEDHFRAAVLDFGDEPLGVVDFEEVAADEVVLGDHRRELDRADLEAGRIGRAALELAAGRVGRGAVEVQHFVPARGQFAAELHLEGMAGVVVDDDLHGSEWAGGGCGCGLVDGDRCTAQSRLGS